MALDFYKKNENDIIWWAQDREKGGVYFSFDKKTLFTMTRDYPFNLSKEQKAIFDRENPFWADYFKGKGGANYG